MRFVLVAGTTRTARIDGLSAAGASPALMAHTPAADAEIVEYGRTTLAPVVPVSPSGCPTPAVVTRAVRELLGFQVTTVDAGLSAPTGAGVVDLGVRPGADIRDGTAVPEATAAFEAARRFGASLPEEELVVGETIPGGTTTAQAVLSALGEDAAVSSSLPSNPVDLKREVVESALEANGLTPGDAAGDPMRALRTVGDPVLAVVAGLTVGAVSAGTDVVLAGGTQQVAAAALVRHANVSAPLSVATTRFVRDDDSANVAGAAAALDVELTVTDPGFERSDHPAMARYVAGEAKEGVGMGGALAAADRGGVPMAGVRDRIRKVYARVTDDDPVEVQTR